MKAGLVVGDDGVEFVGWGKAGEAKLCLVMQLANCVLDGGEWRACDEGVG